MRAHCLLALALVGCGTPSIPLKYRPVHVDPALGCAPEEALAEWEAATGGRYPARNVGFYIGNVGPERVGVTSRNGNPEDGYYDVTVVAGLSDQLLRRVLLHELGHVAGLLPDPTHPNPSHWHGWSPSVMREEIWDCSDEIGAPELGAFDRQYGR